MRQLQELCAWRTCLALPVALPQPDPVHGAGAWIPVGTLERCFGLDWSSSRAEASEMEALALDDFVDGICMSQ